MAGFSTVAAVAAVALLLALQNNDDPPIPEELRSIGFRAEQLAADARQINDNWDAQRNVLEDPERLALFNETQAALEELVVQTGGLLADAQAVGFTEPELVAAAEDMATAAQEMLDGLNAPGRLNVSQRLAGLEGYLGAAVAVQQAAGTA